MRQPDRRFVIAAIGAAGLSACARPFDVTERKKPPKGGIGGTGIVGTLTGFGSLIINGLKVELAQDTTISTVFGTASFEQLAVGQSLTIEASTIDGKLIGKRVRINHPVIGAVESVDTSGQSAVVAGVQVELEGSAIGRLQAGSRIAVSGVWRGTGVVASRIDRLGSSGPSVVEGVVHQVREEPAAYIAGVPILAERTSLPETGTFVSVIGQRRPEGLSPTKIIAGRFVGAAGPLINLSVEGYLQPTSSAPFYAVSGLGHSFDQAAQLSPFENSRTIFTGDYEGTFVVRQGLLMPEDFGDRRKLVEQIARGEINVEPLTTR